MPEHTMSWIKELLRIAPGEARTWPLTWRSLVAGLLLFAMIVTCECLILLGSGQESGPVWRPVALRVAAAVVVGLPVLLAFAVALPLVGPVRRGAFELWIPPGLLESEVYRGHLEVVRENWEYERRRFRGSLLRILPSAFLFGAIPTLALAGLGLLVAWYPRTLSAAGPSSEDVFAVCVATSVVAAFGLHFVRILVRIAGQDFNARMFSWSNRSVVLIVIATAGLFVVFHKAGMVSGYGGAVLLGIFAATLGDRAIELLLTKAAGVFGVPAPKSPTASPLGAIDGMSDDDIARFGEEQVFTVHDLAFAPTARLFFNTAHSLQRICDWQDQALLLVYAGPLRVKALFDKLGVRSAIDLQALAQELLPRPDKTGKVPAPPAGLADAVGMAVGLEGAALNAFLGTIRDDDVVMRLRIHWQCTPAATVNRKQD
jgi:hypothetical protein